MKAVYIILNLYKEVWEQIVSLKKENKVGILESLKPLMFISVNISQYFLVREWREVG